MTQLACDYSDARPSPAAIKAAGYIAVLRYLSPFPQKNLSPAERDALFAAGLGILLVWESTANRATADQAAGAQDAAWANNMADTLGYPADCPIFYAVDTDVQWPQVAPYFEGARSVARRPVKVYGSAAICGGAATAGYGADQWQTCAWSGTTISQNAAIYQRLGPTLTIPNEQGQYDEDVILKPVALWAQSSPPFPPSPPSPSPQEPDMTPFAVVDSDGALHVFARSAANHLVEYVRAPAGWACYDLTQLATNGVALASDISVVVDLQGVIHVFARSAANHLIEYVRAPAGWSCYDLTALATNGVPVA